MKTPQGSLKPSGLIFFFSECGGVVGLTMPLPYYPLRLGPCNLRLHSGQRNLGGIYRSLRLRTGLNRSIPPDADDLFLLIN